MGVNLPEIIPPPCPPPSATKRGEIHPQSVFGRIAPTFAKGWRNPTNHAKVCGGLSGEQGGRKLKFMKSISLKSPAKVNLYLKVLGKRPDGYHELVTLFHRISLCDQIVLTKTKEPVFRLSTNHPKLKRPGDNLIYKAHQALKKIATWPGGVKVKLVKKTPVAAGLGGGSSNAAHFLIGMNCLFKLSLSRTKLLKIGSKLGADVPFFLYEVNQGIGTGKGDQVRPLTFRGKYWFAVVVSPFELSTPLVYKRLNAPSLTRISHDATITSEFLRKRANKELFLKNDLFLTASRIRPKLKQIDALFDRLGVAQRLMSGSGPTMFSIHKSKREAERIAQSLRKHRPSAKVFVCHTH